MTIVQTLVSGQRLSCLIFMYGVGGGEEIGGGGDWGGEDRGRKRIFFMYRSVTAINEVNFDL